MAWESRRKGRYYYRKVWRNGTAHSEYVGAGLYAEFAEQQAGHEQAQREAQRQAWQEVKRREEAIDKEIDDIGDQLQVLVDAALLVAGFHRHKRTWRKQRANTNTI